MVFSLKKRRLFFVLPILVVILDQLLKHVAPQTVLNFGVFAGIAAAGGVTAAVNLVILLGLWWWWFFAEGPVEVVVIALVSVSNLIDRFTIGAVVDYIFVFGFWVNLADIVITCTLVWLVVRYFFLRRVLKVS